MAKTTRSQLISIVFWLTTLFFNQLFTTEWLYSFSNVPLFCRKLSWVLILLLSALMLLFRISKNPLREIVTGAFFLVILSVIAFYWQWLPSLGLKILYFTGQIIYLLVLFKLARLSLGAFILGLIVKFLSTAAFMLIGKIFGFQLVNVFFISFIVAVNCLLILALQKLNFLTEER